MDSCMRNFYAEQPPLRLEIDKTDNAFEKTSETGHKTCIFFVCLSSMSLHLTSLWCFAASLITFFQFFIIVSLVHSLMIHYLPLEKDFGKLRQSRQIYKNSRISYLCHSSKYFVHLIYIPLLWRQEIKSSNGSSSFDRKTFRIRSRLLKILFPFFNLDHSHIAVMMR